MKIKKLGHCCFVAEINGKKVMTDPGSYSNLQDQEQGIDLVLITHEHPDHLHVDSLKNVIANNPGVKIITNNAVGKILADAGVEFSIVEDGQSFDFAGITISGHGTKHEEIYKEFGLVDNTGYMLGGLFYPGDAFTNPGVPVDILALPVAGPWMKLKSAIDYAIELKPRICFPVHDGMIETGKPGPIYRLPNAILPDNGILFKEAPIGQEVDL